MTGVPVFLSPVTPRTVADAGLAARYFYFGGRSGRRYLFTRTDHADLSDFGEGVAICVVAGQIVWSGEIAALAAMPRAAGLNRPAYYVHLLAASAEARRDVAEDLGPQAVTFRLAA